MKKAPNYNLEQASLAAGLGPVVGIDEVGRGCLAGPVVAAAVVLDPQSISIKKGRKFWWREVRDSKLLLPEKRFMLEPMIKQYSLGWGIGVVSPQNIDELNIHHASLLAMKKAIEDLTKALESFDAHGTNFHVLVDGRFVVPGLSAQIKQTAIVDGDMSVLSISAASILAKTFRDRLMVKLHKKFPEYNFAQHKGYGTKRHWQAIHEHGLSSIHRLSFCGSIV